MVMDPTLQTLGQSLGHWQGVYIVSIVVALVATFAIVIFAFHIQEHKFGLKVGNYIYVVASLLAVLATIVILNKTHSIDAEKDREVKIATDAADLKIAQADKDASKGISDAAAANQKAAEATRQAAEANSHLADANKQAAEANKKAAEATATAQTAVLDKVKILKDNLALQQQLEQEKTARQQIENRLAPRTLSGSVQQSMITQLRQMLPQDIDIVLYAGNPESDTLARQIAWVFQQVNWQFHFAQPMGGSLQGVRIEYDGQDKLATKAAIVIESCLKSASLELNESNSAMPPLNQELGSFTSDGKAGSGKIRIFVGAK
jgi:hypothetical protein